MKLILTSIPVNDQSRALAFYTGPLGFTLRHDIPMGGPHRWLTVTSPHGAQGMELLLEPMAFEPARVYQQALYAAGIPAASFGVDDLAAEHQRLTALGVRFTTPPRAAGPVHIAVFADTCGNLIQLLQQAAPAAAGDL